MMRPRCGTGGDKSGRLYFCRPISRHGNHFYPQSLSRSTSLISAVTVALSHSCWPCLSADACSSDPGSLSLSLSLNLFLCPRHHSGQLTSSHSSPGEKYHSDREQRDCPRAVFHVSPVSFHPSFVYASMFFFLLQILSSCPIGLAAQL